MNSLDGRGAWLALLKQYGPLLPALGLVGLLYGGGLLLAIAQSVGLYGLGQSGFTLQGYRELLQDDVVGDGIDDHANIGIIRLKLIEQRAQNSTFIAVIIPGDAQLDRGLRLKNTRAKRQNSQ
ncbi:MAG: hypothetical protein Q6M04_02320, partial [Thermostichus sp. BF3_bins_97]